MTVNFIRRVPFRGMVRVAVTAMTLFATNVLAQDISVPTDPVAKAAFDVLERHCARCHQVGRLSALDKDGKPHKREKPDSGFGNILALQELADTPSRILPGNPHGSNLFKQIIEGNMPYDVVYSGAKFDPPTPDEVKAVEVWIASLGKAPVVVARPADAPVPAAVACDSHKFVSRKDMIAMMAADLETLPKSRAKGTRYLSLTHLTNICVPERSMKVYRQAAIKLVNSLSRSATVVTLTTLDPKIDPDGSLLRINIDDLGWDASDWEALIAAYPYATRPVSSFNGIVENTTGTKIAFVRADWFAFVASRPGMYEKLLKLPKTFQALAKEHGVDVDANIRNRKVQRAGFQDSGVSQHNRLIERHVSKFGYFWTSYDFGSSRDRANLFDFPLGPGGPRGFEHDGGETIFSLPNGFQAYFLNAAKGNYLEKGPTNIVHDKDAKARDPAVINGISCMRCHDQGMKFKKDEIGPYHLVHSKVLPREERELVKELYPPHATMDLVLRNDARRFAEAMRSAGLDPALTLDGTEMIFALSLAYEQEVGLKQVASELGLTPDAFEKAAREVNELVRLHVRRIQQGLIKRDTLDGKFIELAKQMADEEPIERAGPKPSTAAAKPTSDGDLTLTSDKKEYAVGERPVFTIVVSKDCFLTISNLDQRGNATVLFPNKGQQDNRIRAGAEVQVPPAKDPPFRFRVDERGVETVIAVCTEEKQVVDGIKHDFTRSVLTTVPDYTRSAVRSLRDSRTIKIDVGDTPTPPPGKPAAPAAKPAVPPMRSAIQILVK